jgi:spoIIIJ-associated protein
MKMVVREFEGKNEKEAIDRAIEELGLDRNEIDFEIVEAKRPGILFRGGKVKIRVHMSEEQDEEGIEEGEEQTVVPADPNPATPFEEKIVEFTKGLLAKMGFQAEVTINRREEKRLGLELDADNSGILIGKQGKTLEALQFLVNLAAGRMGEETTRIVIDTQDYRARRERSLVRMANQVAEQVRRGRDSRLLEAMNPFERRLIHTTLATHGDIETVSEGDGLYKRIRVIYRGERGAGRG